MKLYHEMVKQHCSRRGISLQQLLKAAGVSSNAYYSLAGKSSALPKSILKLAEVLAVPASSLLHDEKLILERHLAKLAKVDAIAHKYPDIDRDTIRHTLTLLEEPPIDRLRRALELGRCRLSR